MCDVCWDLVRQQMNSRTPRGGADDVSRAALWVGGREANQVNNSSPEVTHTHTWSVLTIRQIHTEGLCLWVARQEHWCDLMSMYGASFTKEKGLRVGESSLFLEDPGMVHKRRKVVHKAHWLSLHYIGRKMHLKLKDHEKDNNNNHLR